MSLATYPSAKPIVPAFGAISGALSPFAEPLVRVVTGLLLVPHGAQKLFGWFGGYGVEATGRVRKPTASANPPKNSIRPASSASEAGKPSLVAKNWPVASTP